MEDEEKRERGREKKERERKKEEREISYERLILKRKGVEGTWPSSQNGQTLLFLVTVAISLLLRAAGFPFRL